MSFGFRSGSTPARTDPLWVRWAKILTHYQSQAGADARNDLRQNDPLRMLKVKVLRALEGAVAFVPLPITPTAPIAEVTSGKVGGNTFGLGFLADAPFSDNWQTAWSATGTGDPTSNPGDWTLEGTPSFADATSAEGENNRNPTDWGAIRYQSGGVWSPWTRMTGFP